MSKIKINVPRLECYSGTGTTQVVNPYRRSCNVAKSKKGQVSDFPGSVGVSTGTAGGNRPGSLRPLVASPSLSGDLVNLIRTWCLVAIMRLEIQYTNPIFKAELFVFSIIAVPFLLTFLRNLPDHFLRKKISCYFSDLIIPTNQILSNFCLKNVPLFRR